jgi:sec-independent protein translocase protein TatB
VVRYVRTRAGSAQEQLSRELGPGFEDLDLRDLNPRTFVQKHLLDEVEPVIADVKKEITDVRDTAAGTSSEIAAAINGAQDGRQDVIDESRRTPTPYDAEAT